MTAFQRKRIQQIQRQIESRSQETLPGLREAMRRVSVGLDENRIKMALRNGAKEIKEKLKRLNAKLPACDKTS